MRAQLIDQEDGGQIVVFPSGFEMPGAEILITQDGDRLILRPITDEAEILEG